MNEFDVKIILLGEATVGKSSLIIRYTDDTFKDFLPNTIGAAFVTKEFEKNNEKMRMNIWDTCG